MLIPDSNTSVVTISKLAVKPQPTPAMAASKPATGCLPTARKISAPIGGMITNAASEEMWLKKAWHLLYWVRSNSILVEQNKDVAIELTGKKKKTKGEGKWD